ncbi:hypothetical protein [Amycolatopsis sp. CA-126428]|uniref:hypothetical protein n=1 Tax=Amycolatopsis sp. CA-126428 TaxID=2073158 RepID=UPI000CD21FB6|nr:hypothetical protein [Amycolatopsis sp. CA-126428]
MTAAPYQYPYGPPPVQPPADPGAVFRLLAAILGVLAAVLVITGSFLPQTSFDQVVDGKTESSQTISAWSRSFAVEPTGEAKKFYDNTHVARYGIPLTTGAVVLLAGAGLALAGARRSAGPGLRSGARTALVAGAAGVTAAVWMLGMDVSSTLSYETDEGTIKSHYATGLGFWVLIGGGVIALLALVAAALAGRRAPAAAPAGPPPGPYQQQSRPYPVPPQQYGPPHPGYPASQPFPAQAPPPQTGPQPPPYGGPPSQPFPAQQADDPYGGVTQAQQHPAPQEPTEPNYQLPPLHPPKT